MQNPFSAAALAPYLEKVHKKPVRVLGIAALGGGRQGDKGYGYGMPLRVDYELDGAPRRAVLETVRQGGFGHEHMADRAQLLLWAHDAYARLPRHVASLDVGAVRSAGELTPLGDVRELFLVAQFVEGREYADDLLRIRAEGSCSPQDAARASALSDYLVGIHAVRGPQDGLYARRIRELLGHGECIFGIVDSFPAGAGVSEQTLQEIEKRCLEWRWRLKGGAERLRQIHGDFHPWNILFREGMDFSVLDRSRGEWGEPADDVACLTMNYLFFSLQRSGKLEGAFERLFREFWDRYLERSGDAGMTAVIAPFYAFRALVMASPVWYPALAGDVRGKIVRFMLNVLGAPRFEPARVNAYCEA